jgi:hypothetical protein
LKKHYIRNSQPPQKEYGYLPQASRSGEVGMPSTVGRNTACNGLLVFGEAETSAPNGL